MTKESSESDPGEIGFSFHHNEKGEKFHRAGRADKRGLLKGINGLRNSTLLIQEAELYKPIAYHMVIRKAEKEK
jgi:hypothetical protein